MKIEIKSNDSKAIQTLVGKMIELNSNSIDKYDYLEDNNLYIGYNENSGFNYIYLENDPSLCLCTDFHGNLCTIYSSGLDGLEFIRYDIDNISSLSGLENLMYKAYNLEDEIRGEDYKDDIKKDAFIEAMINNGWKEL